MKYLTCAETAKLIRKQLSQKFPGVKFSVRSQTYSMGASIDVGWTLGPTKKQVEAVTEPFAGAGFDGMIDLKYDVTAWLSPDGSATWASSPGTEGSMGQHPAFNEPAPCPGAEKVSFGSDHVFCHRDIPEAVWEQVGKDLCALQHVDYQGNDTRNLLGENDRDWLSTHLHQLFAMTPWPVGAGLEAYAGVRYATEAEREADVFCWVVIETTRPDPIAAEIARLRVENAKLRTLTKVAIV